MPITKEEKVTGIEVLDDGRLVVRMAIKVLENGKVIAKDYAAREIDPGDDVSGEDVLVQDVAQGLHTQARVDARKQVKADAAVQRAPVDPPVSGN